MGAGEASPLPTLISHTRHSAAADRQALPQPPPKKPLSAAYKEGMAIVERARDKVSDWMNTLSATADDDVDDDDEAMLDPALFVSDDDGGTIEHEHGVKGPTAAIAGYDDVDDDDDDGGEVNFLAVSEAARLAAFASNGDDYYFSD